MNIRFHSMDFQHLGLQEQKFVNFHLLSKNKLLYFWRLSKINGIVSLYSFTISKLIRAIYFSKTYVQ